MSNAAFYPIGATVTQAATASSGGAALAGNGESVRVVNDTTSMAFVKFGVGAQTATAADLPIPATSVEVFRIPDNVTHYAVILATGTGNVYFTRGEGF